MSLLPFFPGGVTGGETFYPADEVDVSGTIAGTPVGAKWESSTVFRILTWSGTAARVYRLTTPVAYRIGALTGTGASTTLTPSVSGTLEFFGFDIYSSSWFASRDAGTGETAGNQYIEKYNTSGTAQQKLDTGLTSDVKGVRCTGSKLFYLSQNILYERTLSTPGDLSTASGATAHTLTEVGTSQASDFCFNSTGSRLYVVDSSTIEEYSMTSYNVGARSYVGGTSTSGLFVGTSGYAAFMSGTDLAVGGSTIYKLSL